MVDKKKATRLMTVFATSLVLGFSLMGCTTPNSDDYTTTPASSQSANETDKEVEQEESQRRTPASKEVLVTFNFIDFNSLISKYSLIYVTGAEYGAAFDTLKSGGVITVKATSFDGSLDVQLDDNKDIFSVDPEVTDTTRLNNDESW